MYKVRYSIAVSLVLLAGFAFTLLIPYLLYQKHSADTRHLFETAARDRVMAIEQTVEAGALIGKAITGLYAASNEVTREEFSSFTALFLKENSFVRALEWAPRVIAAERESYEFQARQVYPEFRFVERNSEGVMHDAPTRSEFFPVYYLEPYQRNEQVLGFNLASDPIRRAAIEYARDNNMPSLTGRVSLIPDTGEPGGLTMFFPVYKNAVPLHDVEQRRLQFLGLVLTEFDIHELIKSSLKFLRPEGVNILVEDISSGAGGDVIYFHRSRAHSDDRGNLNVTTVPSESELRFNSILNVNDRQWRLTMFPEKGYFKTGLKPELWLVGGSLLTVTLVLFAYIRLLNRTEQDLRRDKNLLEKTVQLRTHDLTAKNEELEAYSYSVAHDLRAPLRSIVSFSQIVAEDAVDKLNDEEKDAFSRIISAAKHMSLLIDDILELARVSRSQLVQSRVNLADMARSLIEVYNANTDKPVEWLIGDNMVATGDASLLRLLLSNLLGNAWKFSSKTPHPVIQFERIIKDGKYMYVVRDNGIGFDMQYADKVFGVFQRLHAREDYEGTGIGLATAQRIIKRHGGDIWIESKEHEGTAVYFHLNEASS